jgi:regulator of nucleoside diphosphate kinase
MTQAVFAPARPHIIISRTDADRLSALAEQMERSSPLATQLLLDEIDRAEIREDHAVPDTVVGMHSIVEFQDEAHGKSRIVELVYPAEADIGQGRISVLTPVGAGLIGLSAGQTIMWPDRDGHERPIRILKVVRRPTLAA